MKNSIESGQLAIKLSPEEIKISMSLETIPFLEKKDRVFLVLVWRGLKTASAVSLESGAPESVARDLEKRVQKAGLFFKRTDDIITEEMWMVKQEARGLRPGRIYFVANNQKDLDLISELWFGDHDNDPKVYKEIGRMSGFPQTAIDLYDRFTRLPEPEKDKVKDELVFSEREKRDFLLKLEPGVIPFSFLFCMSKEHYEREMEIPRKWAQEIKSVTPALYIEFTDSFYRSVALIEEIKSIWKKNI